MTEIFDEIVLHLNELPTLPTVVSKVLELLDDSQSSVADVEKIVSNDQSVAGKILKIANSAYYGFRSKVVTIRHATVLLGFGMVRTLCLGIGVFRVFDNRELSRMIPMERFWEHCIGVATASRILWEKTGKGEDESIFLAGLLHDVGKTALITVTPERYATILKAARRDGKSLLESEREALGGDHARLGGMLCKHWHFAPELIVPIAHHHEPARAEQKHRDRAVIVHLADYACRRAEIGWSGDKTEPLLDPKALDIVRIGKADLAELVDQLDGLRAEIASFTRAVM